MRRSAPPKHLFLVVFAPEMSNQSPTFWRTARQAPCQKVTLVQHNSLGSWDVFLSLFNSFVDISPVDIVLLQDPPSCAGFLPSFSGFKSFAPSVPRPKVAIYASLSFLSLYTSLPEFSPTTDDVMHLDVYTPLGCFSTNAPKFRFMNLYSRILDVMTKSVPPKDALPDLDFPCLVAGDFNIHIQAADPLRVIFLSEESASAPYFACATDLAYTLLNNPGVYTWFPLEGQYRPRVINLAFASPLLFPAFVSWDSSSIPSTGSDHVTIKIILSFPTNDLAPWRPMWDKEDWAALKQALLDFKVPTRPPKPVHETDGPLVCPLPRSTNCHHPDIRTHLSAFPQV